MLGDDELEDGVTEKFESLIIKVSALFLMPHTRMGERLPEQLRIAKLMRDALFQRMHGATLVRASAPVFSRKCRLR
jgi:hypothetical protein